MYLNRWKIIKILTLVTRITGSVGVFLQKTVISEVFSTITCRKTMFLYNIGNFSVGCFEITGNFYCEKKIFIKFGTLFKPNNTGKV